MSAKELIDKKSGYYIATYSAHASVIENIIGANGKISKLLIDGGGLKAHNGTFTSANLFSNYHPVTNKTLHAKIIYLDKQRLLSLWTGNLRKQGLEEQDNIIITGKVNSINGNKIKEWFNQKQLYNHLFVFFNDGKIEKIENDNKCRIWEVLSENLNDHTGKDISIYAFSPWGSYKVIKNMINSFENLRTVNLYTRYESEENPVWVDSNYGEKVKRYIRKKNLTFPHYKCIFITEKKQNNKECLIWAYIGSANLTEAAFLKKDNIEYASVHNNIKPDNNINKIFKELKRNRHWDLRELKDRNSNQIDEEDNEYANKEYDDTDNFLIRKISKELIRDLSDKKMQKKMEDCYRQEKEFIHLKKEKYRIRITSVSDSMFDICVRTEKIPQGFDLQIVRLTKGEVLSKNDVEIEIQRLIQRVNKNGGRWNKKDNDTEGGISVKNNCNHINLRFPVFDYLRDEAFLKEKRKSITRLSRSENQMTTDQKKIFLMWSQLLAEI